MNYIGLNKYDTANGPGIRVSLHVSGCTLRCKGCFYPESWNFKAGKEFTDETLKQLCSYLDKDYIQGLSILGGEPLEPENEPTVTALCKTVNHFYPNKTIWLWTGKTYDIIKDLPIMEYIDTVVAGPYEEDLHVDHCYYGSSNQQIIHLTGNNILVAGNKNDSKKE